MIRILGLGPGAVEDLTIGTIQVMKGADKVWLRTEKHPNTTYLKEIGVDYHTFDAMYDSGESFDEVYERIAEFITSQEGDVVYAVPGHPLVAEKSVALIIDIAEKTGISYEIIPAVSFIDAIIGAMKIDPVSGLKLVDGLELGKQKPDITVGNIITQVYSKLVISDAKICLMDHYDDEQPIFLIRAAGVKGLERIEQMPLYMLDRVDWIDYLTSIYIPPVDEAHRRNNDFSDLVGVMERLRAEDGCPWDREQTHESLKRYLIEEAYEVIDAIDGDDMDALCEELGDVLLQVVFHAQIASEFGEFDIRDVIMGITDKMIKRHVHVFGNQDEVCHTADEVLLKWEDIKREEKRIQSHTENLKAIPRVLPALIRSFKVQEKAAKVGFDWDRVDDAIGKIHEELEEFLQEFRNGSTENYANELGDLLFAVVNTARFLHVDPEFALNATSEKFIKRFAYIEEKATENGRKLEEMTLEEMDLLWNEAKSK